MSGTVNGRPSSVRKVNTAPATKASAQRAAIRRALRAAEALARQIEELDDTNLLGLKKLVDAETERRWPGPDEEDERWV